MCCGGMRPLQSSSQRWLCMQEWPSGRADCTEQPLLGGGLTGGCTLVVVFVVFVVDAVVLFILFSFAVFSWGVAGRSSRQTNGERCGGAGRPVSNHGGPGGLHTGGGQAL